MLNKSPPPAEGSVLRSTAAAGAPPSGSKIGGLRRVSTSSSIPTGGKKRRFTNLPPTIPKPRKVKAAADELFELLESEGLFDTFSDESDSTLGKENESSDELVNETSGSAQIKVAVRFRPPNTNELNEEEGFEQNETEAPFAINTTTKSVVDQSR
eukprot:Trichotokara_eunicae@DN11178_c0_g1_i1.p1